MRLNQNVTKKDRLALNFNLQNRSGNPEQLFGYRDETSGPGINTDLSYTRNLGQRTISVAQIQLQSQPQRYRSLLRQQGQDRGSPTRHPRHLERPVQLRPAESCRLPISEPCPMQPAL